MKNVRSIIKVLGTLFTILGLVMMICAGVSLLMEDGAFRGFVISGASTIAVGLIMFFSCYNYPSRITKREGYLIVGLSWIGMAIICSIPFRLTLDISIVNALFESTSGLTTTGATIFNDIEVLPHSVLIWRSLTQWMGGMGIIVLTVALLPLLGVGGVELFTAEAPGPTSDKIHPRIRETAKRLWIIYFGLTATLFLLLWIEGMTPFDAINHAFTTMATGGFSTKNASIAYFDNPQIEYTISLFMLFAGINYTVLFFLFTGRWRKVIFNQEWQTYLAFVFGFVLLITTTLIFREDWGAESALRASLFQVISIITTTGFVTSDYTAWGPGIEVIFFLLLFMGGCAGSTSGGIKTIRHLVFIKNSFLEFKRLLHPKAMIRLKINGEVVAARILTHILVFLLLYLIIFFSGSVLLSTLGLDFSTALGAMATSLSNVGPAIGEVGPVDNFSSLNAPVKVFLSFVMLLGRLEIYSILILMTPFYWRDF